MDKGDATEQWEKEKLSNDPGMVGYICGQQECDSVTSLLGLP